MHSTRNSVGAHAHNFTKHAAIRRMGARHVAALTSFLFPFHVQMGTPPEGDLMRAPHRGIALKDLNRLLIRYGGKVESVQRTGEIRYRHPRIPQTPRGNGRRADAPMNLVMFVRQVIALNERG